MKGQDTATLCEKVVMTTPRNNSTEHAQEEFAGKDTSAGIGK